MSARVVALLVVAAALAPRAQAGAATPAAVVVDANTAQALSELTTVAAARHKVFDVISSADVRRALELEANKQIAGCSEATSCMAEIAGAMGARYVVFGSVASIGTQILLSLNLFDSKLATSAGRVSIKAGSVDDLLAHVDGAVDELLGPADSEATTAGGARVRLLMMDLEHATKQPEPPPAPSGATSQLEVWSTGTWMLLGGGGAIVAGGAIMGGGVLAGITAQSGDTQARKEAFQDDAVRVYGDRDFYATIANSLYVVGAVVAVSGIAVAVAAPFYWE